MNPPGLAGYHGPLLSTRRAITVSRLAALRLAVGRLAFSPKDTQDAAVSGSGPFYELWRDDATPVTYAPPRPVTTFTVILR